MPDIEPSNLTDAREIENIRHESDPPPNQLSCGVMLTLDFVLEHPAMNLLHDEPEKVEFFEEPGLPHAGRFRVLIYYGVVGNQKRYFALKLAAGRRA